VFTDQTKGGLWTCGRGYVVCVRFDFGLSQSGEFAVLYNFLINKISASFVVQGSTLIRLDHLINNHIDAFHAHPNLVRVLLNPLWHSLIISLSYQPFESISATYATREEAYQSLLQLMPLQTQRRLRSNELRRFSYLIIPLYCGECPTSPRPNDQEFPLDQQLDRRI
jgi:hypothetical protein